MGSLAIQRFQILQERRLKFAGKVPQRSFRLAHAFDDFVINIGNVHDLLNSETFEFEIAADQIAKNKSAPVPDVSEVIHRGPAAIHAYVSRARS